MLQRPKRLMEVSIGKSDSRRRYFCGAFVSVLLVVAGFVEAHAQITNIQIKILSVDAARVRVELDLAPANVLSFPNAYAGILGLANRIEGVEASIEGRKVPIKKLAPGEYKAELAFSRVGYEVILVEPDIRSQMSHVSWLNKEQGLLMLADLLPTPPGKAASAETTVGLEVPTGWAIAANIAGGNAGYLTVDPDDLVFLVGPSVHKKTQRIGAIEVAVVTSGAWPFSNADALKIVEKLIQEYSNVTGYELKRDAVIMLLPFGREAGPEQWTAETRGNAVVLLLGNQASRKKILAKLSIVLTHEVFHLWVPNALALEGDYDWFFEGFTLYQALRMALRLKLISFDTYLETIARVYDSYLRSVQTERLSLVEASQRRWTVGSSLVYDKGMIVGFIYDLAVRSATACRHSLDDVYRQLFRLQITGQSNANEIIIKALNEQKGMDTFGRDYVTGTGRIDLVAAISSYGLDLRFGGAAGTATRLRLVSNPTKTQREALRCIGYRE